MGDLGDRRERKRSTRRKGHVTIVMRFSIFWEGDQVREKSLGGCMHMVSIKRCRL